MNEFGQPVGEPAHWAPGPRLEPVTLTGRTCRLEPLTERHVDGLYDALCVESPASLWTYMNAGPFADRLALSAHLSGLAGMPATVPLAVLLPDATPVGVATWLRIDHDMGTAEIGHITYAASLQRTTAATEAMYLMAAHAFEVVGLRRYEWKCDSLNAPSRRAAERLGFAFEGVFRKAIHYKGRNRDTAWYAMVDDDWPQIRGGVRRLAGPRQLRRAGPSARSAPVRVTTRVSDRALEPGSVVGCRDRGTVGSLAGGDRPGEHLEEPVHLVQPRVLGPEVLVGRARQVPAVHEELLDGHDGVVRGVHLDPTGG